MNFFSIISNLALTSTLFVSGLAFADTPESREWFPTAGKQLDNPMPSLHKPMSVDFESFTHEEVITLPWTYGAITISGIGGNYLPLILDATRYKTVLGPRSMGIATGMFGSYMKVTFKDPLTSFWLSFIKGGNGPILYTLKDTGGKEVGRGEIVFQSGDPEGTYRTFFINFSGGAKTLEFSGAYGLLVRIAAH